MKLKLDVVSTEGQVIDGAEAWIDAGRRLLRHDPEKFRRMLSIARAFVALYERGIEDVEVYRSRISQISSRKSKILS